MNTDKAEILNGAEAKSEGVTSGVRDGQTQGVDGRSMTEAMTGVSDPVQNDGVDDIEPEGGDVGDELEADEDED